MAPLAAQRQQILPGRLLLLAALGSGSGSGSSGSSRSHSRWLTTSGGSPHSGGFLAAAGEEGAPAPLAWRPPVDGAVCATTPSEALHSTPPPTITMTRQTCTLPRGTALSPASAMRSDLLLREPAAMTVYFSHAWNSWSLTGAPIIFASVGDTTFLYSQQLGASGGYLDACPVNT